MRSVTPADYQELLDNPALDELIEEMIASQFATVLTAEPADLPLIQAKLLVLKGLRPRIQTKARNKTREAAQ